MSAGTTGAQWPVCHALPEAARTNSGKSDAENGGGLIHFVAKARVVAVGRVGEA